MADRSKFNVDADTAKRSFDGIIFDSVMEMRFYRDVVLPRFRSGEIRSFELQKSYTLQPKFVREERGERRTVQPITYVADFYLEYADGRVEVIDTKGCPDSVAKIKRKMFWYIYPDVAYRWICYSKMDGTPENGGWCEYETVQKRRAERRRERAEKSAQERKDV